LAGCKIAKLCKQKIHKKSLRVINEILWTC
jgi:hypothetical protein